MTSAPHLLTEDRPEFDRILDEVLRTADERPELATLGERLNAEQLRTMAMEASALLTAAAAAEYDHYVKIREEQRDETLTSPGPPGEEDGGRGRRGKGAGAAVVVLAPVLAGTAMLIFLLVGYALKMVEPEPAFATTILTTGWFFGALTAAALLLAVAGLLVTAVRNSSTEVVAQEAQTVPDEVARAREAWRNALLERGIVPFLRDALADPGAGLGYPVPLHPGDRAAGPGHSSPGSTGPGTSQDPRTGFGSPDFTSPDFGGPGREPE
ncbi:hypothetical protein [Streptomyces sp. NPDC051567]|uniref:hypothetical protein n=1 Tax=Streptomyces sp. NPDC051567 TaxID=3365660 RepID=UPI00379D50FE